MNDVGELKEYTGVHARSQRIAGYRELLARVRTDDPFGPGSWVGEWCRAAEALESQGRDLEAARHYAMARFPYAGDPVRQEALERCVQAFDRWRSACGDIQPVTVDLEDGKVRCWTSGLSATSRKPLLVVMGGIVAVKEQWAPVLRGLRRLHMAGLVTEMPATGENTLRYGPESWRMLSGLLDAMASQADVAQTHAITFSFSGHMALRCAVEDPRIKSVITVGAPVSEFFTDPAWQRGLPQITVDTLAHMTGIAPDQVAGGLSDWALTPEQLAALNIPIFYASSLRDEITHPADVPLLRGHVRELHLVEYDDVHAAPHHVPEVQLWTAASLLRARGIRNGQSAIIGLLRTGQRVRRRLGSVRRPRPPAMYGRASS